MKRHRLRWRKYQARVDPSRLVFIDETWTKTNMTRRYGWAPRGRRLIDKVPHGHWKTQTFLAALRCDRVEAPCLFDGPINGERFRAYVEQFLVPALKPDDIVVADNLGSHKGKAVRQAIKSAGARLIFFPNTRPTSIRSSRYSPSSKASCEKPPRAPSTPSPTPSPTRSPSSTHRMRQISRQLRLCLRLNAERSSAFRIWARALIPFPACLADCQKAPRAGGATSIRRGQWPPKAARVAGAKRH